MSKVVNENHSNEIMRITLFNVNVQFVKVGFWVIKTKELQILSHYVLMSCSFIFFPDQRIQCYLMTINSLLWLSRARNSQEDPPRVSGAACVRVADCALLSVLICYEHLSSAAMISIFQVKKTVS